jgi:uncharacterized protein (TIGR02996 family)
MTTASDLLDGIRQSPEEDAPRLVYADWLEECGDALQSARADLIRAQIALADPPEDHRLRRLLWEREQALLKKHEKKWFAPLKAAKARKWRLDRGLVGHVTIPANLFRDHANALFAAEPIHALRLTDPRHVVRDLAALSALGNVRTLELSDNKIAPEQVAELLASPHLAGLTGLDLSNIRLGREGVQALVASGLPLTALNLAGCRLGWAEVRALATAPSLRLTQLDLDAWGLADDNMAALLASPLAAGLRELRLPSHVGEETLRALATVPSLSKLELGVYPSNAGVVRQLGIGGAFRQLRRLNLMYADADIVQVLVEAPLERLEVLDLWAARLSDVELTVLATAPWATGLRSLSLRGYPTSGYRFGDTGVGTLARSFPSLRVLRLEISDLTAAGARALVEAPFAASLRQLSCGHNPIRDDVFCTLASRGRFPALVHLEAGGSSLGPAGARALIGSGLIEQLELLDLECTVPRENHRPLVEAATQAGLQQEAYLTFRAPIRQQRRRPLWNGP